MEPLTIEAVRINPEILGVLEARARRARSAAVNSLIVRLIERLTPHSSGHPFGIRLG